MVTRHNMKMPEYRARFKAFSNQHIVTDNIKDMCLCRWVGFLLGGIIK